MSDADPRLECPNCGEEMDFDSYTGVKYCPPCWKAIQKNGPIVELHGYGDDEVKG